MYTRPETSVGEKQEAQRKGGCRPLRFFLPTFFGTGIMGRRQAAKTQDFGSCIRRFESSRPSHIIEC